MSGFNIQSGFIATSISFMSSVDAVSTIREKLPDRREAIWKRRPLHKWLKAHTNIPHCVAWAICGWRCPDTFGTRKSISKRIRSSAYNRWKFPIKSPLRFTANAKRKKELRLTRLAPLCVQLTVSWCKESVYWKRMVSSEGERLYPSPVPPPDNFKLIL